MNLFEFDKAFEVENLCGVDEAGRGPLAGPVVAAAVILNYEQIEHILNVNDSKKLSVVKRKQIFNQILKNCKAFSTGIVEVDFIEKHNILNATMFAMQKAVNELKIKPNLVLVDGNRVPELTYESKSLIKADTKSACVAAASIIAKVVRDEIMEKIDEKFPQYGFKQHKGYATKLHYENLKQFGPCKVHRLSFLKKKQKNNFSKM